MSGEAQGSVTREDVRRVCGDLADHKLVAILALQPRLVELEAAAAFMGSGSNFPDAQQRRLEGTAGQICAILEADGGFTLDEES